MAALFDWVKLVIENKWLIILLFGSVSGAVGNVTQYFQIEAKTEEVEMTQKQVAAVAESYHHHSERRSADLGKGKLNPDYSLIQRVDKLEAGQKQLKEYH